MRRFWLGLAVLGLALVAPASAQQQQQRDPFNGQFGALEIVTPPAEAAALAQHLGEALANLQPQRPGQQDVYIITASLWSDPVFQREATQAEAIMRPHLGAEGRSIILSAGGDGERRYPSAAPNDIAAAIGRVGSLIDPNEDLVVIFLTSHGAPDGSIALREHNRMAASMRPTHFRDLLNQAGIRNRVVIVSACFSGSFIAPLLDDNTIVLTAAASDRSSFGCQPQRDWTFFGDAYFSQAMRSNNSMIGAFDDAKVIIERWEREQNLTPPSNPQRYVGSHAAEMLRRAERDAR